jgi:peptide/nickel transport system substrate-binding protein
VRRFIFSALAFLAACGQPPASRDFTLRIAVTGALAPVHPSTSSTSTTAAMDLVFEGVLRPDAEGRAVPGAVRSVERLGPNQFRIDPKPDLRFSDGSPVTAGDLVRSLRVSGVAAEERNGQVEVWTGGRVAPEAELFFAAVFKETQGRILGTGPYAVAEASAERIVLRRVRPEPGRIAVVEIVAYPTPRDAFARTLRGDANAVLNLDDRQSELLEGIPGLRLVRSEGPHAVAVLLNAGRLGLEERRAIVAALPASDLAAAYGGACRLNGPATPATPLRAGSALDVLASDVDAGFARVGLAVRRALGPRGAALEIPSAKVLSERNARHDFDATVTNVIAWPPALLSLYWTSGGPLNWTAYSNSTVDAAIRDGRYSDALAEMERDPPVVFLCQRERIAAVDARIKNPTLGRWGLLETLPEWEVGP